MTRERWRIRLSKRAERDFEEILETTLETFGERQLEVYRATVTEALAARTPYHFVSRGR
jgi:toxin ParE1/3/4